MTGEATSVDATLEPDSSNLQSNSFVEPVTNSSSVATETEAAPVEAPTVFLEPIGTTAAPVETPILDFEPTETELAPAPLPDPVIEPVKIAPPPVAVPQPIFEPVVVEIDTSAIISEQVQNDVVENILKFSNPVNLVSTENVTTPVDFGTNNPSTYSLGPSNELDNNLFTINSSTGALSFLDPPDFERPSDSGKNNVYNVQVFAKDSSRRNKRHLFNCDHEPRSSSKFFI